MKIIKVGIRTFKVLEPWEVNCDHDFSVGVMVEKVINPNKEFVEGYGCEPLVVRFTGDRKCVKCGMLESVFREGMRRKQKLDKIAKRLKGRKDEEKLDKMAEGEENNEVTKKRKRGRPRKEAKE